MAWVPAPVREVPSLHAGTLPRCHLLEPRQAPVASTSYAPSQEHATVLDHPRLPGSRLQDPPQAPGWQQLRPLYLPVELAERPSLKSSGPGGGGNGPGGRDPDFYANLGSAIRTLREDIPLLFQKDLDYDIYREDVVFRDPKNSFKGKKHYQTIFWSLRLSGQVFFRELRCTVHRLWQLEDTVLRMRWSVIGYPRVPWEACGIFDGVSEFRLDSTGKIYEHAVDNVILRDPPRFLSNPPFLVGLNLLNGPSQQPVPTPALRWPQHDCLQAQMLEQSCRAAEIEQL